jgi:ENTS family enterobactin (siderophore) exporter
VRRRGVVFAGSGIALGGLLVVFGFQHALLPSIILAYCVAAASQLFITMASALYNTHTPDELRGRVMGLSTVVVQGGMSLGAMVIGSLGAVIGIGAALSIGGGIFAATTAAALARVAPLRDETRSHPAPHTPATLAPVAVGAPKDAAYRSKS